MVFFLLLALIGLVCRPSPKKPEHQGGQRKDSSEGRRAICPLMKAAWWRTTEQRPEAGRKTPETQEPKNGTTAFHKSRAATAERASLASFNAPDEA